MRSVIRLDQTATNAAAAIRQITTANGPTSSPPTRRAPTPEAGEVAIWHAAQLRSISRRLVPAKPERTAIA